MTQSHTRRRMPASALAAASMLAGLSAALMLKPQKANADSSSVLYQGHDLGLDLKQALAQIQATGGSRGKQVTFSISGAGDQVMFTEVSDQSIETETASYKALDFSNADVRKVAGAEERYGITLRAAPGSVNDHVLPLDKGRGGADRSAALNYMDFWLADADMSRTRHLADLFATIQARLQDSAPAEAQAPVAAVVAPLVHDAAMVVPAPHVKLDEPAATPADEATMPAQASGKCLLQAERKPHRPHLRDVALHWQQAKSVASAGNGRLNWRISPMHGTDDPQAVTFSFTNGLPVTATLVARVILTSSTGAQQAENLALGSVAAHATQSDDTLAVTPFSDTACITDVDVTVLRACPVPDDATEADESANILACNADAASGTTVVDGVTYVAGREPKSLDASRERSSRAEQLSSTRQITEADAARN